MIYLGLVLLTVILTSCSSKSQFLHQKSTAPVSTTEISAFNCGPKLLLEVCKIYDIPATEEELTNLSETKNGITSFLGLSKAAKAKGLECVGAQISFEKLKTLVKENQVIAHFSQNRHFVLIKEINNKTISIYDPALAGNIQPDLPIHLFIDDWDGNVLILNKELKI